MRLTDHHVVGIKRQLKPNTRPPHLTVKAGTKQLGVTHMTFSRTWIVEHDTQDRSMDHEDVPRRAATTIYAGATSLATPGPKTADGLHQSYVAIRPDIEAPHTLIASLTKSWNMNS